MNLTREHINDCVTTLLQNSEICEALNIIKGEGVDENEKRKFLSKIIESLILQKLVEAKVKIEKSEQGREFYSKRKDVKKKNAYQFNDSTEKSLSFAVGIKDFFTLLDYNFRKCVKLEKKYDIAEKFAQKAYEA